MEEQILGAVATDAWAHPSWSHMPAHPTRFNPAQELNSEPYSRVPTSPYPSGLVCGRASLVRTGLALRPPALSPPTRRPREGETLARVLPAAAVDQCSRALPPSSPWTPAASGPCRRAPTARAAPSAREVSSFSSSLGLAVTVLWVRLGRVSSCASLGGSAVRRSRLGCGLRGSVGFAAVAGGEGSGVLGTWSGLDLVFFRLVSRGAEGSPPFRDVQEFCF